MHYPYNKKLTPAARDLRRNMTPEEKKLWYQFLCKFPVRFLRQKIIDNYIIDFYCAKCKLGVEIDGNQHLARNAEEHDAARTEHLNQYGVTVIRFSNDQVRYEFIYVCNQIEEKIKELLNSTLR